MKKRVLLFSPNMKGMKEGVNRIQPSLGIGYLAAVCEQQGYEVYVQDTALEGYENRELQPDGRTVLIGSPVDKIGKCVEMVKPDVVGISVLFSNLAEHAHTIAKIVKEYNPKIKVILGGNHISNSVSDYEYAIHHHQTGLSKKLKEIEDTNIDYLLQGEGEASFIHFLQAIFNNLPVSDVRGLVYKDGKKVVINPKANLIDLKSLPFPARHLLDMDKYFKIGLFHSSKSKSTRVLNVMCSRGCPEKCSFCTTPIMWGNKVRWRDARNVFEEIKQCVETYEIKEIQFEDDSLTANKNFLLELCDLLEPLKLDWCTPNGIKVNYFLNDQPKLFKRMKGSGCYQITLACESGNQEILDHTIGKRLKLEEIAPAVKNAKEAGLFVHTFWIVGFPGETKIQMEQTIKSAESVEADSYSVSVLTPLPGTPIYGRVIKENLWWSPEYNTDNIMYRNSLIKVDGFDNPQDFEKWVDAQNVYLNSLIENKDPERAKKRLEMIGTIARDSKLKQT